jgi:tripartite-type tricarboxylate transporter receptor subunit TctC
MSFRLMACRLMSCRLARLATLALAACALLLPAAAPAQDYPNRTIRLVLGFAPGGNTDFVARLLADRIKSTLGQNLVIENRPGANGAIAADAVAKSPPDGYTLFITSVGAVAINPSVRKDLPYDPVKDFAPIALLGRAAPVLSVGADLGVTTAPELVALAKQKPGRITIGISGIGAISHLGLELFEAAAGVKFLHVPYRGSGPALTDLLGGQVNGILTDVAALFEHIKAGKLRTLGMTGAVRSDFLPQIPTLVEQGYADVVADNWTGLLAPAGTPRPIVLKLNAAFTAALNEPATRRRLADNAVTAAPNSPEEFGDLLKSEIARWSRVIREKGIIIKPE